MRKSGRWMVLVDDRILEALEDDGFMTPSELGELEEIRYSEQYIGDRCRKLAEESLLENVGNGVYRITESGRKYLKGEINTADGLSDEREKSSENTGAANEETTT